MELDQRQVPVRDRRWPLREPGADRAAATGCRHIYCFDASGGRQLAQLGDAIALARSELGVDISFPDGQLERLMENEEGVAQARCAAGTLTYRRFDPPVRGKVVYVPTVFTENLPWDVRALSRRTTASHITRRSTSSSPTRSSRRTGCSATAPPRPR